MSEQIQPTERTRVKRLPARGVYDRAAIDAILDEGFVCHVGFTVNNQPFVIPTGYARVGDAIYVHGSTASRMVRSLAEGLDICVTVTLVDGLVLARSAFHHSINYRSVVVFGRARPVIDSREKVAAMRAFTNHVVPGRWDEVRSPTDQEMKGTTVLALGIEEASAKVRTGPPIDDDADRLWPVWAGVVPLRLATGTPVADAHVLDNVMAFDVGRLAARTRKDAVG